MLRGSEAAAHINVHGHDNTRKAFSSIRKNITGFNSELKNTALTFAGAFGVKQLVDMADSITDLRNRLNSFNNDSAKTAQQMDLIGQVALKTRSSFEATGVVFTRMIQATQHLGITSEELAAASATVNATFKLSGTTAYEAANSARQLAQGLSSGRLSGDEMRSVLENNVVLANLLADGFGVTVGQLREMGAAGKVTTEKIMPILIGSFEETTEKVSNMQFTIDAAFTLMQTRLFEAVRRFNEFTGVQDTVANAIAFVANNMNQIAVVLTGALVPAIGMATMAMFRFLASMVAVAVANPITLAVAAIGAAFGYFLTISDELVRKTYNFFGKLFLQDIPNFFTNAQIGMLTLQNVFSESINKTLEDFQSFSDGIYMVINGVREFMGFENLTPPKLEIDIEGNQAKIEELKKQIKTFTLLGEGEKPKFLEDMELFLDELDPARLAETLKGSAQVVNEFTDDLNKAVTDFFAKQLSAGQAVGKLVVDSYKKFTDTITDFVMKGKASFADLFRFIRQELVRLYVQEKITTPLFTALGLKQKQGGGQVVGGTPYMVGEKGAELFIPSTSGNIISASDLKNAAKSSPTAEPINVNFNIQATDASGFDQLLTSRKNQIVAMISQAMNQKGKAGLI
jgi:tape measure domain-containing protein